MTEGGRRKKQGLHGWIWRPYSEEIRLRSNTSTVRPLEGSAMDREERHRDHAYNFWQEEDDFEDCFTARGDFGIGLRSSKVDGSSRSSSSFISRKGMPSTS